MAVEKNYTKLTLYLYWYLFCHTVPKIIFLKVTKDKGQYYTTGGPNIR